MRRGYHTGECDDRVMCSSCADRERSAKEPIKRPLKGVEIIRWFGGIGAVRNWLDDLLERRALVCTSPNREGRCDRPATGIFFQDGAEWYPCCDAHWPSGQQWTGNTQFRPRYVGALCFAERMNAQDASEKEVAKFQEYDRTDTA